jgi:DNA invertase Pin-like site-specific DNA recombinase
LAGEASCNPEEGAALTVLEPAFSTKDAAGPILVTVLGMMAETECKFIRERQQAGIEAATVKGAYKGRKPLCRLRRSGVCMTLDMAPR